MNSKVKKNSTREPFMFEISLTVLNHLGRNLYRSFITVIGEAISNSWDANANNVWIEVDKEKNSFFIKDDGDGMDSNDFQDKFLRIGYTKRNDTRIDHSARTRPYIGRKGIGKLALLSCADKITVISKKAGEEYDGGVIDNSGLDKAIKDDLNPSEYSLGTPDYKAFDEYTKGHEKGTIIYFENVKEGIHNRLDYLKKTIALYYRFSLIDDSFNIYLNGDLITLDNLDDLAKKTQFLWNINGFEDPYIDKVRPHLIKEIKFIKMETGIKGFIASVETPKKLKITEVDEKVTVDLFVNGRLRERDLLKHIPTERLVESYLYGQIHVDSLDEGEDRFATGREGIVADDPKFKEFLDNLRKELHIIFDDWDVWRIQNRKPGDPENSRLSPKERSSSDLFNAVATDYTSPTDECLQELLGAEKTEWKEAQPEKGKKIKEWVQELNSDAQYNFPSYAECFISENLLRRFVDENNIEISETAKKEIETRKNTEISRKAQGNINIDIRKGNELSYLNMNYLVYLIDKDGNENNLIKDSNQYKPIRDALMHTALLTDKAKLKLTSVHDNIEGRLIRILYG